MPKKGYADLLQALALLPKEVDWRFHHIGGGPLLDNLKSLAETLQIASYITWQGSAPQEQVLEAYRAADIFVLASCIADDGDRDGLPNVLMEAQSQKLAVVATNLAGIAELVVPGETGLLVPPGAPENLSGALLRLMRDPGAARCAWRTPATSACAASSRWSAASTTWSAGSGRTDGCVSVRHCALSAPSWSDLVRGAGRHSSACHPRCRCTAWRRHGKLVDASCQARP